MEKAIRGSLFLQSRLRIADRLLSCFGCNQTTGSVPRGILHQPDGKADESVAVTLFIAAQLLIVL
ncbi:MAG: hypothetical protein H6Q60_839 [Oscillospiraceae bacterium]|nr:hypothetical protein [Oscillospiraceae bacterium]